MEKCCHGWIKCVESHVKCQSLVMYVKTLLKAYVFPDIYFNFASEWFENLVGKSKKYTVLPMNVINEGTYKIIVTHDSFEQVLSRLFHHFLDKKNIIVMPLH